MAIQRKAFPAGLTVAELKALIAEWPEAHEDGTPCEVWIDNGDGTSTQANDVWPLDARHDDNGIVSADLELMVTS